MRGLRNPSSSRSLQPGAFARLQGLERAPELNGELCEVLRPAASGRWIVATRFGERSASPESLKLHDARLPPLAQRFIRAGAVATALLVGLVVRMRGRPAPLVPLAALCWLLGTLSCCAWLHGNGGGLSSASELSLAPPGRGAYRAGFLVVGLLLALTVWLLGRLRPSAPLRYGYLAAFGTALQGLLTLEVRRRSAKSLLHGFGASLFALGAVGHALTEPAGQLWPASIRRVAVNCSPVCVLLALVASRAKLQRSLAALQWLLLLQTALFLATYIGDLWLIDGAACHA